MPFHVDDLAFLIKLRRQKRSPRAVTFVRGFTRTFVCRQMGGITLRLNLINQALLIPLNLSLNQSQIPRVRQLVQSKLPPNQTEVNVILMS